MATLSTVFGLDINLRWWYLRALYELSSDVQSRTVSGVTAEFVPSTFHEYRRVRTLTDEEDVISDIVSELRPGDVFYDIGANIGTHSCFAGQVAATVHAFEPHPETARRLRANLSQNGGEFTVHEVALSDSEGTAELGLPVGDNDEVGVGTFTITDSSSTARTWDVSLVVGDKYVDSADIDEPDVVKIDVEGAELGVIDGLRDTLAEARVIYCEVHLDTVTIDDVTRRFNEFGLSTSEIFRREGTVFLKAARP
ncbi:FkbM family methyltransferase [Halopelagius fulvigenes]|uniref:FkbM family methyltransferase n=1 Tax=Halopelagius fulvigenes TaxID=1198324 RepID=A0ABD5TY07_9EURY